MSATSWTVAQTALVCLGISGILSHRLYFIQGEHHLKAPQYLAAWFSSMLVIITILNLTDFKVLQYTVLANCAFLGPLFGSIVIYRTLQHPLRDFNGPRLASITKIWHLAHMFRTSNHLFLDRLVKEYGRFVRTGPQELTIVDPDIWDAIGSRDALCIKAPWYDMLWPYISLNSIRGKEGYRTRRKQWDEALRLSTTYLPDKESCITRLATLLVQQVYTSIGQPMNVTTLFSHFSFDVMGEIAFSRSFSLLQNRAAAIPKESYDAPTLISQGMSMLRFFTPVPWVARLCFVLAPYMPIITQKWNRALNWAAKVCDDRLERSVGSDQYADAFSRFIHSSYVEDDRRSFDRLALYGDAFAITVAGSHSTAATLTMLCFELARHPEAQQQARNELLAAHYHGGIDNEVDGPPSERYPFLDSCIKETLRLYPVVPTGGIRQTVAKGIHVGGRWIPPQTVIVAPRWTLGRLECAFDKPNEFIPERWTSKQHMVKNARVFNAFGIGQHFCPGKQLGLAEVRLVAAELLTNFMFTHTTTEARVLNGLQDVFTLNPGEVELVFRPLTDLS